MKKSTPSDKIEAENLLEEAKEILEPCVKCGMCKSLCPVFKVLKEEGLSPRGHAVLLSNKVLEQSVFHCNLCKACELKCPLNLRICDAVKKARQALDLKGKELKTNKEMIENVRKTGSPFGNKPVEGDKLYCC